MAVHKNIIPEVPFLQITKVIIMSFHCNMRSSRGKGCIEILIMIPSVKAFYLAVLR